MDNNLLKDEILRTLSFLEPMSLEYLFLDFDKEFLLSNNQLTYEDLLHSLDRLKKDKKVKIIIKNKQKLWIKIFPKKAWYKRLFS